MTNAAISASIALLISFYVSTGFGVAILAPGDITPPVWGRARSALVRRDVSSLFGHEDLFFCSAAAASSFPHMKMSRELATAEFKGRQASR